MLHAFITVNQAEIITRCRARVATRLDPAATSAEIDHGVPMFLGQLLDALRHGPSADLDIARSAAEHGQHLLAQGYTVSQVVHDYGDVCQVVTELAVERQAAISAEDFHTLNRCLDDAIAGAVTEYARSDHQSRKGNDRLEDTRSATVARDLLKAIKIARVSFEAIKSGRVGVAGSTGAVLSMGLVTAHDLAERWLAGEPSESLVGSKHVQE